MNILFDTNVILDVMLDRTHFSEPASHLLSLVEKGNITGFICAATVTTIHYLTSKVLGNEQAQNQINNLIRLFDIAPVNRAVLEDALKSKFTDFEDTVIYQASYHISAEAIVTRDIKGFKKSEIPVYNPTEMLKIIDTIK